MNGPVVVGIDDFENSDSLIAAAVHEAKIRQAALWLAHVYSGFGAPVTPGIAAGYAPEELLRENAVAQLEATATRLREGNAGLHVETLPLSGSPAHALTDAAAACGASLLVVGGRGRGGFTGQLLGSVSLRALTLSHSPVLVVRGGGDSGTRRVMIGVDIDDPVSGPDMIAFAFEEADVDADGVARTEIGQIFAQLRFMEFANHRIHFRCSFFSLGFASTNPSTLQDPLRRGQLF